MPALRQAVDHLRDFKRPHYVKASSDMPWAHTDTGVERLGVVD
jgi:hypothetical protein